jgi:hypothetical protein
VQEALARAVEGMATYFKAREFFDPMNRHPKEEPFKRYLYDKKNNGNGAIPYRTEWPTPMTAMTRLRYRAEDMKSAILEKAIKGVRLGSGRKSDPMVDDYLVWMVKERTFSSGF